MNICHHASAAREAQIFGALIDFANTTMMHLNTVKAWQ
jgi:hypothetical protein